MREYENSAAPVVCVLALKRLFFDRSLCRIYQLMPTFDFLCEGYVIRGDFLRLDWRARLRWARCLLLLLPDPCSSILILDPLASAAT